ncbi:hypothetical protein SLE2022_235780 [Rubroshorea leprosula]
MGRRYAMEYMAGMGKLAQGSRIGMLRCNIQWQPSESLLYKLNVDGTLFVQNRSYGMGAIVSNPLSSPSLPTGFPNPPAPILLAEFLVLDYSVTLGLGVNFLCYATEEVKPEARLTKGSDELEG